MTREELMEALRNLANSSPLRDGLIADVARGPVDEFHMLASDEEDD